MDHMRISGTETSLYRQQTNSNKPTATPSGEVIKINTQTA